MTRGRGSRTPTLDEARSRFEQWRRTRQGKAPIPDELWSVAAAVARRNGKLRIHCQAVAAAELAALSRTLWDMAR